MKRTLEQKQQFIAENIEKFFESPKTSSTEYKDAFNAKSVEDQYATILRWVTYNAKKAEGTTTQVRAPKKSANNTITDLMNGDVNVEITNENAAALIEKFNTAIETLKTIMESNKQREREEISRQIEELNKRLMDLD